MSGRIPLDVLSLFASPDFVLCFAVLIIYGEVQSTHRGVDRNLLGLRFRSSAMCIRTICAYVTLVDFTVRLGTFPVNVTLHHSLFVGLWMD